MEELAPHMRKFARLIKEIYQLDEVRYEDLKLEVDPTYAAKSKRMTKQNNTS